MGGGVVVVGQEQGNRGGSWKEDESLKKRTSSPLPQLRVLSEGYKRQRTDLSVRCTQQEISLSLHYNGTNPTVSWEESLNSLWRYFSAYCLCAVNFYILAIQSQTYILLATSKINLIIVMQLLVLFTQTLGFGLAVKKLNSRWVTRARQGFLHVEMKQSSLFSL